MVGDVRLVERQSQLDALAHYWAESKGGRGRLVLVGGEAGVGKTALIREFIRRNETEAKTLTGGCEPVGTPLPLGPIFDVASRLSIAFQEMLVASTAAPDIRRAFMAELDGSARPTLLVIEDVHWADEATLDLLRHVARRLERLRVLVVLTYRDDELPAFHPLRKLLRLGDRAGRPPPGRSSALHRRRHRTGRTVPVRPRGPSPAHGRQPLLPHGGLGRGDPGRSPDRSGRGPGAGGAIDTPGEANAGDRSLSRCAGPTRCAGAGRRRGA
jgi:hypothetical protein